MHDALARIYVDTNNDPSNFLKVNKYYNSKVVGEHCEHTHPDLAIQAYRRDWGKCDEEMIMLTNRIFMYRVLATYVVEREDAPLWTRVLNQKNQHRQKVVDLLIDITKEHVADFSKAKKARVWKAVCHFTLKVKEFKVAHLCADQAISISSKHKDDIIEMYRT